MKKWKTTLVALLAVFALTSCGNNKANDSSNNAASNKSSETEKSSDNSEKAFEGKTLTLAGLDGGYGTKGWKKVIANFEKKTGAKVEAKFEKNIHEVIRPEIQAGNAPDVFFY